MNLGSLKKLGSLVNKRVTKFPKLLKFLNLSNLPNLSNLLSLSIERILGGHRGDKHHAIRASEAIHIRALDNLHRLNVVDRYQLWACLHTIA